jgi:hypothetical protein
MEVPNLLEQRAFTPEYVQPLLLENAPLTMRRRVAGQINASYFASFANELRAGYVTDLVYLGAGTPLESRYGNLPYRTLISELRNAGELDRVLTADPVSLVDLRHEGPVGMAILEALEHRNPHPAVNHPALDLLELDLASQVAAMKKVTSGTKNATTYHRRVAAILSQVFQHVLGPAAIEKEINEGRKRLDVLWPNWSDGGVFQYLRHSHNARHVIGECKNYSTDPKNPELDQLIGRFTATRSEFGLLLCRTVRDRALMTSRCRDLYGGGRGLVVVLDDTDVETLAGLTARHTWKSDSPEGWLYENRILPLI